MKGLLEKKILEFLPKFLDRGAEGFDDLLSQLMSDKKSESKNLLRYINAVLDDSLFKGQQNCDILHLHFEEDFEADIKLGIAEFLLVKFFYKYYAAVSAMDVALDEGYEQFLKELEGSYRRKRDYCPEGASTSRGGNRLYKNWQKEVGNRLSILKFYRDVVVNQFPTPKTIFNTGAVICGSLASIFEFRPYATPLDSRFRSYNVISHGRTLNDIDYILPDLLNGIDSLVIYDYEWNKMMANMSFEEINNWNNNYDTSIRNQLIVTFGKGRCSYWDLVKKSMYVREKLKVPADSMYILTKMETDDLLGKPHGDPIQMSFIGEDRSDFWDILKLETQISDLYELRSIRLLNVYSICLDEGIRDYIMEDLFSFDRVSHLISFDARQTMQEMNEDDLSVIKNSVFGLLDLVTESGIREKILDRMESGITLVMDDSIVDNPVLMTKVKEALGRKVSWRVISWSEVYRLDKGHILFLSYRDPGRYPNLIHPNLLELDFLRGNIKAEALLQKALFDDLYGWASYQLQNNLLKNLDHPVRRNQFGWLELKTDLMKLKPARRPEFDWKLETEFARIDQRERYNLKLLGYRHKTVYESDLYISTVSDAGLFSVKRIDMLHEEVEEETGLYLQSLDEIHEAVNFYGNKEVKKMYGGELVIVLRRYGLEDEVSGKLWKLLLKRRADSEGEEVLYEALKTHLRSKNLQIVSIDRFKNFWLAPLSDTICPASNRVFKALCDFLSLDNVYYFHIIRERNARYPLGQMTRKWIHLYKDLFNDCFFDVGINLDDEIEHRLDFYKTNHPIDELGISEDQIKDSLNILVQLIKNALNLLQVEYLRKNTL
jgi:hypothetical protein